jgi:MFS family permease
MNPPNCASLFGACQGLNPPVNRPIVASVVPPELRGQAFAIFLTIFETIGWAVFALGAGRFAASVGIQTVFLWVLVGLMLVNAAVLSTLTSVTRATSVRSPRPRTPPGGSTRALLTRPRSSTDHRYWSVGDGKVNGVRFTPGSGRQLPVTKESAAASGPRRSCSLSR